MATLWHEAFTPGQILLHNLVALVSTYDFGVFVFAPDDTVIKREDVRAAVRDNVIFEVGIFMGGLGLDRTFVVEVQETGQSNAQVPTDLEGLIRARVSSSITDDELAKRLEPIIATITAQGPLRRTLHDEIRNLRSELRREIELGNHVCVLGDLVTELARSRSAPWSALTLPRTAFLKLTKRHGTWVTNEVYWWLVVLGILRFKGIEAFTSDEGWHWTASVEYVEWSGRGVALLNEMQSKSHVSIV
jgi:hypothetical protein